MCTDQVGGDVAAGRAWARPARGRTRPRCRDCCRSLCLHSAVTTNKSIINLFNDLLDSLVSGYDKYEKNMYVRGCEKLDA